jgi:thioesterase domain-containing protein
LAEIGLAPGLDFAGQLDLLAAVVQSLGRSLPASPDQLASVYATFSAMVRANRVYQAPRQHVDVLVLRASQGRVSEFAQHPHAQAPCWGWSRLTEGHTEAFDVEGTHQSLLTQPAVAICAQRIQSWMSVKAGGKTAAA